jgi:predicted metal-binding protein
MIRIGIITCRDYWKTGCPGYRSHFLCFLALEKNKGPLGHLPGAKIVSMRPCPGCPGNGRLEVARRMIKKDKVRYIVFPSCVFFNNHCSTAYADADNIEAELGLPVLRGSYMGSAAASTRITVVTKPGNVPTLTECWKQLLNLNYLHHLYERKSASSR